MNSFDIKIVEDTLGRSIEEVTKTMERAEKSALKRGASTLRTDVKKAIRKSDFNSTSRNPKYTDRLIDGVRSGKVRNHAIVTHIMGTSETGSGTYRLRFFEGGTRDRIQKTRNGVPLKEPINLGHITAYNFFNSTLATDESKILSAMDEQLTKYIERAWNNKNK